MSGALHESNLIPKDLPASGRPATKRCFVISPIGEEGSEVRRHADAVYRYIIRPAMRECGIDAIRSDHLSEPGMISQQMIDHILADDLCIALLTGHNPNVFYELGVAHASGRPVIILVRKGEDLPFDVKDLRCVHYDLNPDSFSRHKREVIQQVMALDTARPRLETPLALASRSQDKRATWERVEDLTRRLCTEIQEDNFEPDLVVGVGRGGAILAGMLAGNLGYRPLFVIDTILDKSSGVSIATIRFPEVLPTIAGQRLLVAVAELYSGEDMRVAVDFLKEHDPGDIRTVALFSHVAAFIQPNYAGETTDSPLSAPWRFTSVYSVGRL